MNDQRASVEYVEHVVDLLYILILVVCILQLVETHWSSLSVRASTATIGHAEREHAVQVQDRHHGPHYYECDDSRSKRVAATIGGPIISNLRAHCDL